MIIVGCMGPPGGGRNPVSNRMLRHFNFLSFTDMSDESCVRIFDTHPRRDVREDSSRPRSRSYPARHSAATIAIYNTVRRTCFPPRRRATTRSTCATSRGCSKGYCARTRSSSARTRTSSTALDAREPQRVPRPHGEQRRPRVVPRSSWTRTSTGEVQRRRAGTSVVCVDGERLDLTAITSSRARTRGVPARARHERAAKVVEEALEDYNSVTNAPMKLVMFLDAIEHVSRVCRVIRSAARQRAACSASAGPAAELTRSPPRSRSLTLFQIEVAKGYGKNEWRDDLRKVLLMAGAEGKDVVFLFTDTQIVQENFPGGHQQHLNSGEVPNLWKSEDTGAIGAACDRSCRAWACPSRRTR